MSSGLIYCVGGASSNDDITRLVQNYLDKIGLKNLAEGVTAVLSEDLKSLKNKSLDVDKEFQECNSLLSQIPLTEKFIGHYEEDDDVLLVGDNFHNIASKEVVVQSKVFACKNNDDWSEGILCEITNSNLALPERKYWVKFTNKGRIASFSPKRIAFAEAPTDKLGVGTRIIALYPCGKSQQWHSGVVAESPTLKNMNRYLVFFDDGYAQYNKPLDIRQVYVQSKFVWEDVKTDISHFIKDYIQQYPNRSMVRLKPGHIIKTEKSGTWLSASVVEVDSSLVKMMFLDSEVEEWIYRGSRRLEPLFNELSKAEASQRLGRAPRFRTDPKLQKKGAYVVYTMQSDDVDGNKNVELIDLDPEPNSGAKMPVARKSCFQNQNAVIATSLESDVKASEKPELDGVLQSIDKSLIPIKPLTSKKHRKMCVKCSSKCIISGGDDPSKFKGFYPLLIPILYGWERRITKSAHGRKRAVVYISYCGRILKGIDDLDQCLMQSDSQLTIDLFSYDVFLNTEHEFVIKKNFCDIKDFSLGKENVPIPCVNSVDRQFPEYIEYSTHRIPGKGVNLNVESNFLAGCNCVDNCRDRTKCQCIKLTVDATECIPNGRNPKAGYTHRRLKQPIVTGIYECNSNCSCDHRCHNRVIQNGLNLRLQIFKTPQKGWGLRSLDDIPAGGFICVYSGQILTEESANEDGQLYGDEYLADLDHIDVVEKEKEGYESDVQMDGDDNDDDDEIRKNEEDDDGENDNDPNDCLGWIKNVHNQNDNKDKKVTTKRNSKRSQSQIKSLQRKFAVKKTSNQTWSSKTLAKLKEPRRRDETNLKVEESKECKLVCHLTPANDKEGDSSQVKDCLHPKEEKNCQERGEIKSLEIEDWNEPMYDDLEIEINEDEVLETNDIEEPMHVDLSIVDGQPRSLNTFASVSAKDEDANQDKVKKNDGKNGKMEIDENKDISQNAQVLRPNLPINQGEAVEKPSSRKSIRQLYGEDAVYIIDAKSIGNLGRYFNHSCSPNIFVQNVFYDTHDLRFPWVAFFASKLIKAGTELTWNYNYEVGSVPGKKLACYCGSANCNGRLL